MEIVHQGSGYRSAWRPLNRENDLGTIGSPSSESIKTLAKANETAEPDDVLNKISAISTDSRGLDSGLQDQSEQMRSLLSLLNDREMTNEKTFLGLPQK